MKAQLQVLLLLLTLGACASHEYLRSPGHEEFKARNFQKAAEIFAARAEKGGVNEVLFLLDQGSALFAAQEYERAIEVFLKAEELTEIKDYTSIGEETGVLLTSANLRSYKGEDFEKVLINVYLAMSFAALGNEESALVEARKINLLLQRMITEGKRKYQESPFARYLSAMLWESSGEFDSAYVDYKKTYDLDPTFPGIAKDLLAMSRKNGFDDRLQRWQKEFPDVQARSLEKGQGELVVIFEAGRSPRKVPRDGDNSSLPRYVKRDYSRVGARVKIEEFRSPKLEKVLDIEKLSIDYLEDRIGRMIAAKVAGAATKGAVGIAVGKATENSDLGTAIFLALMATDQADLRSWLSLPANLQILRTPLDPGAYSFDVEVLSFNDAVIDTIVFSDVEIVEGKKTFVIAR